MEPHTAPRNPPTIEAVRVFQMRGPWPTKSSGFLSVPFALTPAEAAEFLICDPDEIERIGVDIRGLRAFFVYDVPAGGVGGRSFHRVRKEISFVARGAVRWTFEDLSGAKSEVAASNESVVCIPPFVLHAMKAEEPDTMVITLANTLFFSEDPRTHDTYPAEVFVEMQAQYRAVSDDARSL